MNKVVCFTAENRFKGQRTPKDAFSGDKDKWHQITQASKTLHKAKRERFQKTDSDLQNRDFIETQLNDTRYISREAQHYLKQLGADISVSKGVTTAWLRHSWGLNSLLGDEENQTAADRAEKKRTDHRHHAIDAVVIACVDRSLYTILVNKAKDLEQRQSELKMRDIHIDPPWQNLREDLQQKLDGVIIAHCPQIKLSGELHEETGAGFIELKENVTGKIRLSGNVNRKNLNPDFTQVDKIIDPDLKDLVSQHLQNYGNNPKLAFAENIKVFHKDGITPIKRVRIQQSKTTLTKLEKTKFAVKDKQGKVFKWLAYGNLHHVEIIRHKQTGEYSGEFVTMMEASHRAKGINRPKQQIVKTEHGEDFEFLMALHINDLVSVEKQGKREYYRVQKLDSGSNRFVLRLHTTTTLDNKNEEIYFSINAKSFEVWKLQKHKVNALGKLI
jgi:CRISPR-associated endonuclease Csn1